MAIWIIHDNNGNIVSNGRLTSEQEALGLSEKEVADVSIGDCVWDSTLVDYVPVSINKRVTPLEFLQLFTITERAAIRTASHSDVIIEDFLSTLNIVSEVELSHPVTIQALSYMVSQNLITQERANEIRGI